ncbi:MAG TPA: mannose-1-phosphate guanylyltransferase/mannose-6-phosphate isomerase [Methanocorpusculum sp.]|nr:mannose-1-phosphate guanylyltransferase/mannose-6-phosphate isomerase [Methanocorpusculum sp.]
MYTIILAGGSGTRLFPLSRSSYPKQFIPLLGKESLFQKAVRRALLFSKPNEVYIVTNAEHKFLVINQLAEINTPECNVLLEPCGKNTLPAILYGTKDIHVKNPDAKILVLSSDQLIEVDDEYKHAVSAAEKLAENTIVTFGIVPETPHTGYGYIMPGTSLAGGFSVAAFKEKPDLETAKKYVAEHYLWNAGIFCFSAEVFLEECRKYAPEVFSAFNDNAADTAYSITPKISIDYGVLEKSSKIAVVPMKISWNDLGSFEAYYSVHEKDSFGNAVEGDYLTEDGRNNLVISDKLVATVGLSDLAIVDTPDVLMICQRDNSQMVGKLAEKLKENGDERASLHTTVHRPWGTYTTLLRSDTYLIKRLVILPHKRISLQYHNHRSEHWVVVKGIAEVTNGDTVLSVQTGESTFIPAKTKHRLANETDEPLEVVEVQQGHPLTEDDIVRIDDDFKRE